MVCIRHVIPPNKVAHWTRSFQHGWGKGFPNSECCQNANSWEREDSGSPLKPLWINHYCQRQVVPMTYISHNALCHFMMSPHIKFSSCMNIVYKIWRRQRFPVITYRKSQDDPEVAFHPILSLYIHNMLNKSLPFMTYFSLTYSSKWPNFSTPHSTHPEISHHISWLSSYMFAFFSNISLSQPCN